MALLDIVTNTCLRLGISAPQSAVSTNIDPNVKQMVSLVNEDGQELAAKYGWQALTKECQFLTSASEFQGNITSLTGADFAWILNETIWDRTQRRPVFGPKSPAEWQQLKAQFVTGPWWQYRIRGNQLLFTPAPPAGDQIDFEWVSKYWVGALGNSNGTASSMINDTDVSIIDERLITLGVIWRFKQEKRLDYSEDYDKAMLAIADATSRDAAKPKLNLDGPQGNIQPGVFVPAGSWGIP